MARDPTCILRYIVPLSMPLNGHSSAPSIPWSSPSTESSKLTPGLPCVEKGMDARGVQTPGGILPANRDCGTNVPRVCYRKHPLEGGPKALRVSNPHRKKRHSGRVARQVLTDPVGSVRLEIGVLWARLRLLGNYPCLAIHAGRPASVGNVH